LPPQLTLTQFKQVEEEMKTIELYYSDTCQDCHAVRRMLTELLTANMKFKEINIEYSEGRKRAEELGIFSVPAVAIDGEVRVVGRVSKDELKRELEA
jgi:alkyl hydroperoxide reductase subunit AhpF